MKEKKLTCPKCNTKEIDNIIIHEEGGWWVDENDEYIMEANCENCGTDLILTMKLDSVEISD